MRPGPCPPASRPRRGTPAAAPVDVDGPRHPRTGTHFPPCSSRHASNTSSMPPTTSPAAGALSRPHRAGDEPQPLDPTASTAFPGPAPEEDALDLLVERATALDPDLADVIAGEDGRPSARRSTGCRWPFELAARRLRRERPRGRARGRAWRGRGPLGTGAWGPNPRQCSVTAALRWSHDLLGSDEQALLDRLAIFTGSFGTPTWPQRSGAVTRSAWRPSAPGLASTSSGARLVRTEPPRGRAAPIWASGCARVRPGPSRGRWSVGGGETTTSPSWRTAEAISRDRGPARARGDIQAASPASSPTMLTAPRGRSRGCDPRAGRRLIGAIVPLWHFRGQIGRPPTWEHPGPLAHRRGSRGRPVPGSAYCLAVARVVRR